MEMIDQLNRLDHLHDTLCSEVIDLVMPKILMSYFQCE